MQMELYFDLHCRVCTRLYLQHSESTTNTSNWMCVAEAEPTWNIYEEYKSRIHKARVRAAGDRQTASHTRPRKQQRHKHTYHLQQSVYAQFLDMSCLPNLNAYLRSQPIKWECYLHTLCPQN